MCVPPPAYHPPAAPSWREFTDASTTTTAMADLDLSLSAWQVGTYKSAETCRLACYYTDSSGSSCMAAIYNPSSSTCWFMQCKSTHVVPEERWWEDGSLALIAYVQTSPLNALTECYKPGGFVVQYTQHACSLSGCVLNDQHAQPVQVSVHMMKHASK